jgi:ABC-2 type transport system ATP-binding protein
MSAVIRARNLRRDFGKVQALDGVSFDVYPGQILGLIGPNGAGKTTALKAILGLGPYEGDLEVLGLDPRRDRAKLMENVCFIADTAVLPRWLKVSQALQAAEGLHPAFRRDRAEAFLARTEIRPESRIAQLSKGMVTQLHLAIVMAVDAALLVLDEPTLGLDILYRKAFYAALLEDYYDEQRTILVTTHQVEEIEHILTDVMFIDHGRLTLHESMDALGDKYLELEARADRAEEARALGPVNERTVFGTSVFLYDGRSREELAGLGEIKVPSIADLFVATVGGSR